MEALKIPPTQSTPSVRLNTDGFFEISGNSLPEDVTSFYTVVFDWIRKFADTPTKKIDVTFKLTYFNSASSKIILELMNLIEEIFKKGVDVEIHWLYLEIDEDMLESGREFAEMISIPFSFEKYV